MRSAARLHGGRRSSYTHQGGRTNNGSKSVVEVNALKVRPWPAILVTVAVLLVLVGLAPLVYLSWWGYAHRVEILSDPLPLKHGEYTSPVFTTDTDDDYQIEIYFLPRHRTPLDLDWKTIDERGALTQSGSYSEEHQMGGNVAILERHYRARPGSRQRIIVDIHQDLEASDADTRLHVGVPERGLEQAYGFGIAIPWAAFVAGPGAILLLVLAVLRVVERSKRPSSTGG